MKKILLKIFGIFYNVPKTSATDYPYQKYVSLGNDCMPRSFFTRWNIKPSKKQGELSMPFDLMFCPYKSINELILNDFRDFFKDIIFDYQKNIFIERTYGLNFNHDEDLGDNIELFKERYTKRIENFRNLLEFEGNILFIQHLRRCSTKNLNNLYEILKQKRGDKPFKLLAINVNYRNIFKSYKINPEIAVINHPYPKPHYVWWKELGKESLLSTLWMTTLEGKVRKFLAKQAN